LAQGWVPIPITGTPYPQTDPSMLAGT